MIRSQWMNHSSTTASYNRQQHKDKQTGLEVNECRCCLLYEACVDEWFIHWLLILFVCTYVVVYYTGPVLTSCSFIDFWSCLFVLTLLSIIRGLCWRVVHSLTSDPVCLSLRCCLLRQTNRIRSQWMNHSSTQASYNRQQRKDKQTGSDVNEWTTRQHSPRIIDNNIRTNKQLTLLSIIRGLCWRVVHSLTSDPVSLSLRCCLLYEAYVERTNKQEQKSRNEPLVNTGLV
jgi:hypothetical protein